MSIPKKAVPVLKLLAFVLTAVLIYFVFRDGRFDEWATSLFFEGSTPGSFWPLEEHLWVKIAYEGGSILTAVWGLSVILCYLLGFWIESFKRIRSFCVLSFLLLALGPGLLVNAVFKDNWGRPRPRDTITFGGENTFQAPFVVSRQGGKSFPCGHCSVGFALCIVAYWARREQKKRWLFTGGWVAALLLGAYLGAARVAVGAHYLSDVLSSAWSVFLVAWLIDCFLPMSAKRPEETETRDALNETMKTPRVKPWMIGMGGTVIFFVFAGFALMAFPVEKSGVLKVVPVVNRESFPKENIGMGAMTSVEVELSGEHDQIEWKGSDKIEWEEGQPLSLAYQLKGFGFPWSDLSASAVFGIDTETKRPVLVITLEEEGFFKELEVIVSPAGAE